MIEKFAFMKGWVAREFLDLNHTSKSMTPVSLLIPKFAFGPSRELQHQDTSAGSVLDRARA
jgi:hypothetical protein